MALPLTFQEGFESATLGGLDSLTNGNSKAFYRHYSYLAKLPYKNCYPYAGAYCGHLDLSLGTTTTYWQEATGAAVAANTAAACRFYFWLSPDLIMAASDTFDLLSWQSAGPVDELSLNLLNNAGVITLRGGDTGAGTWRSAEVSLGQWHCAELVINTGTGVNATCSCFLDNVQFGAQITGITCAALTQARVGAMSQDAGTTFGHLLFDELAFDDSRIGPLSNRFGQTRVLTQSGHAVIGQASIVEADIVLSSSNDETMTMWDTDVADTSDLSKRVFVYDAQRPIYVTKGLYCVLGGTNPIAAIKVCAANDMSADQIASIGRARY